MLFRIISSVVKNCYYEIIGVLVLTRFRFHSFQNAPFQFFMPSFQVKGCHPIDLLLKPSLIKLTPKSKHRVQRTRLFGSWGGEGRGGEGKYSQISQTSL